MTIKQKPRRKSTYVICLYLFNLFDVLKEYKFMLLKINLKFFMMCAFVNLRYLAPVYVRFNCERLTLERFHNTGF